MHYSTDDGEFKYAVLNIENTKLYVSVEVCVIHETAKSNIYNILLLILILISKHFTHFYSVILDFIHGISSV